jgi:hypothetical protein
MATSNSPDSLPEENVTLKFRYIKSQYFRSIKADGAWGGLSPRGDINMALFSERLQIPDEQEYQVSDAGALQLQKELTRDEGIIREVEVAVMMRPETAVVVRNWLTQMISQFENQIGAQFETLPDGSVRIIKTGNKEK